MTPFWWGLAIFCALLLSTSCVYIWKSIPVFHCPNCRSYNVEEKWKNKKAAHCFDCGNDFNISEDKA